MEITGRIIGAFYVFAGAVALHAAWQGRAFDRMLEMLEAMTETNEPHAPKERFATTWMTIGAFLTFLSGVALLLLSRHAAPLFVANALVQGGYLVWAARAMPPDNALAALGRRQTTNAFVLYLAATLFVVWLFGTGGVELDTRDG